MKKISIIDIGTLSIKHYIFGVESTRKDILYHKRYSEANLGNNGEIDEEAINRNITILNACIQKNIQDGVVKTILVGTQILRTASNAQIFCQKIKDSFGLEIKILSHEDEAFYLYKGLAGIVGEESFGAVNIGGGSTEIVTGTAEKLDKSIQIEIGVKTLKTMFRDGKTETIDRNAMEKYLDEHIQINNIHQDIIFITGVLDFYLTVGPQLGYQFTKSAFANHPIVFDLKFMQGWIQTLRTTKIETLRTLYTKDPGFVDNVAIGQTLYYKVAQKFGASQICPSQYDLTDGLIAEVV